jgi:hypothetical protein
MDLTTKIFNKFINGSLGWLELDMDFTPYTDSSELKEVDQHYVPHRSTESHEGWSSCCLHGLGIDKTGVAKEYGYQDEINAPYQWRSLTNLAPKAEKFWKEFPAERFTRIRFMKLNPGGKIDWHNDCPTHMPEDISKTVIPINVAVSHPDNCYMELENHGKVPFKNGKVFLINILKNHTVINNDVEARIHMIGTVYIGNKRQQFNELLERSLRDEIIL